MSVRLTTIAIDSQAGQAPAQWTAAWVQRRLVEAYAIERRLPQPRRPTAGSSWPPTAVEFQDLIGRADEARSQVLQSWESVRGGVSSDQVSKMEQAHEWLRTILAQYPHERLCLASWAMAIAYRRSVRRIMLQRRWSRSSYYRYVTAGAYIVAVELQREKLPVV